MDIMYFGNTVRIWLIGTAVLVASFIILLATLRVAQSKLKTLSASTTTLVDDLAYQVLRATKRYFLFAVSIYLASFLLKSGSETRLVIYRGFFLVCLLQVSSWGSAAITFWIEGYLKNRSLSDPSIATSLGLIGFSVRFVFFALIVVMAIHNFGFDITTLVAGLGVGGIAVALAVQNILADLFASLTIVLDKPFVVGDFIMVGDFMGAIEHIGLKTTRIRSLSGEQLVFSNADLLQSRLRNFKRMSERRVSFVLGVVYQTPAATLERVPGLIKSIVDSQENARFERCHFLKFGSSSLDFEVVYWVVSPDFNVHADLAQSINLGIIRAFAAEKIEFAYPSQTVFVQKEAVPGS
ncbi:MAG: hypothetical protein A2428_10695 [Bdellovibrionales bacterium RIFOXYC1_FULL_54_43]|nr:MAG: hypothetical protein A2428_10695 [Bdellovibrionales bacterium RIFOXYC1_FULL_54_43]OFZ85359.1 MAG: hypothetical protein A2603_05470 [Bdellovibrionales bacterium RIFOXYD1_FULL_55_31]